MIKITQQQYEQFNGQLISDSWYCSPVQDMNGYWFISKIEADALNIEGIEVEFIPPIFDEYNTIL